MAEEFVDLYQVLDLPLDADRGTVRKRINELYLDAQRNLDHRNFATKVKYQELFEVTLPQARYILLDDGRRDEYNRMVNAMRSPGSAVSAPPPPKSVAEPAFDALPLSTGAAPGGFSLETAPDALAPSAPIIQPLPDTPADPEEMAKEREELWKKWKSGLEAALTESSATEKPKARGAVTSAPTSFSVVTAPVDEPAASAASVAAAPVTAAPVAAPTPVAAPVPVAAKTEPKAAPRPKVEISFDFGGDNAPRPGESAPPPGAEEIVAEHHRLGTPEEIEARRLEHRLQITKEILVNVGLIWGIVGALAVIVPGITGLIFAVSHYYPRGAKPLLGYSSLYLWLGGFLLIGIAAFFASRELSKSMRHRKAIEMAALPYEEVLRRNGKT